MTEYTGNWVWVVLEHVANQRTKVAGVFGTKPAAMRLFQSLSQHSTVTLEEHDLQVDSANQA